MSTGKAIEKKPRVGKPVKQPCLFPFPYYLCGNCSSTKGSIALRPLEGAYVGYTGLPRKREVVEGNLVSMEWVSEVMMGVVGLLQDLN